MRARACVLLSVAIGTAYAGIAFGESPGPGSPTDATAPATPQHHTYSLKECLKFAEQNYPKVSEAVAQLSRMRGQLSEARTTAFGGFSAMV